MVNPPNTVPKIMVVQHGVTRLKGAPNMADQVSLKENRPLPWNNPLFNKCIIWYRTFLETFYIYD